MEPVNSYAAGEDDFLNALAARDGANFRGAADIDFAIKRERADVITMRGGKVDDSAGAAGQWSECIAMANVAFHRLVRELSAFPKIGDLEGNVLLGEEGCEPCANEAGTAENQSSGKSITIARSRNS